MFITMLSMGKATLLALKKERKINYEFMRETALEFAKSYGLAVLSTPANTISIAMSVAALGVPDDEITRLGSILYSKRVMGHRIIARSDKITNICGN